MIYYKYKKFIIRLKRFRKSLFYTLVGSPIITEYEKKMVKLWVSLVRDKDSKLSYNNLDIRHVENKNIFMVYVQYNGQPGLITLIDTDKGKIYETRTSTLSDDIASHFDNELVKRMRKIERSRFEIVQCDLDMLLEQRIVKKNLKIEKKFISLSK
jgi:hypothetical protein